jgi:hypothetical protein
MFIFGCAVTLSPANGTNCSIKSFDECAAAGHPIMESYPRQCRAPDCRAFVSQKDRFDIDKNISCSGDSDCALVDGSLGFSCCYSGACDAIDYSVETWIAVNKSWYDAGQSAYCPSPLDCGPAPGCAVKSVNENFTAKCVSSSCTKAPNADPLLGPRCCRECSLAYSESPIAAGPHGAWCGKFATRAPLSRECKNYFEGNPSTVSRCGALPPREEPTAANFTEGSCNELLKGGDAKDKLNIIILPSHHYSDMSVFASDVANFKDALLDFPFYKSYEDKINIFFLAKTDASDGCYLAGNTTPTCDIPAMRSMASACGFDRSRGDQLVALFDNGAISTPYARGETEDNILFIGSSSYGIFVHEFSHSFGDLGDTYDGYWNNTVDPEYANCASDTPGYTCADKWGGLIGTGGGDQLVGCYQNCHAENWYRPTQGGDVMRDLGKNYYDPVALAHMEQLMSNYQ